MLAVRQRPQTRARGPPGGPPRACSLPRGTAVALADPQRAPGRIAALPGFFPILNMPEPGGPRRLLLSARLITPNSPSRYCVQAELPPLIAVIFSSACAGGRGDVPGILILHSRLTPAARMRPLHRGLLPGDPGRGARAQRPGACRRQNPDQDSPWGQGPAQRESSDHKAGLMF